MKDLNIKKIKNTIDEIVISNKEKSLSMLNDILNLLPKEYWNIIDQAFIHKRVPKEYLLSSILFSISTSIGLTFYIEELGYKNYAIYISLLLVVEVTHLVKN